MTIQVRQDIPIPRPHDHYRFLDDLQVGESVLITSPLLTMRLRTAVCYRQRRDSDKGRRWMIRTIPGEGVRTWRTA